MIPLQEVLWEMETPYLGHPYYVTGHALFHALSPRVDAQTRGMLNASHGMFVPGEYGEYPEWHSQSGGVPHMGTGLRPVECYEDLFLFREPAHRWLSDSRPRDAHNTHELQGFGGQSAFAPACRFGRPPESYHDVRTMKWYLHAYLTVDDGGLDETLPLEDETLDGLQVGGARNYGFGRLSLADTQMIAVESLDVSGLLDHDEYVLDLLTPYVLTSEYPGADDQMVPWWWLLPDGAANGRQDGSPTTAELAQRYGDGLRYREERLIVGEEIHQLQTIDHGQVVGYGGDQPVDTAINGLMRVGTHSKYGFGEFRIRPAGGDRVPGRDGLAIANSTTSATEPTAEDRTDRNAAGETQTSTDLGGSRR